MKLHGSAASRVTCRQMLAGGVEALVSTGSQTQSKSSLSPPVSSTTAPLEYAEGPHHEPGTLLLDHQTPDPRSFLNIGKGVETGETVEASEARGDNALPSEAPSIYTLSRTGVAL